MQIGITSVTLAKVPGTFISRIVRGQGEDTNVVHLSPPVTRALSLSFSFSRFLTFLAFPKLVLNFLSLSASSVISIHLIIPDKSIDLAI